MRNFLLLLILMFMAVLGYGLLMQKKQHFSGYTDTLYVYLSSPTFGYVNQKLVNRGQPFKKGELLLSLDLEPELSQLNGAKALVSQAEKMLLDLKRPRRRPERAAIQNQIRQVQASIDRVTLFYNRILKLSQKQFVAQDTIDTNRKMIEELRFQKKALEENLKLAKLGARSAQIMAQRKAVTAAQAKIHEFNWYISHKQLIAPADGYVFDVFYNLGDFVPAQKPIMSVVLPENNYVEFFVSAKDMHYLSLNQTITYQYFNDKTRYPASIFYISQTVEYMPPILFTQKYQEELVFRIRAKPLADQRFILGQPIDVMVKS